VVAGFLVFSVVISIIASNEASKGREKLAQAEAARVAALTPEQRAAEQKKAQDAAAAQALDEKNKKVRELVTLATLATIRDGLRNPDSVKWSSVLADDTGKVVCVEYRAQNGFGGMNAAYAVSTGGKVSSSSDTWNAKCANRELHDMADLASFYAEKTASK
jgi:hypothetical protein